MVTLLTIFSSCNSQNGSNNERTNSGSVEADSTNSGIVREQTAMPKDSTLLIMALPPTLDCLPFYAAKHFGIYDSLGLNLELHTCYSDIDCDTLLTSGTADIIYSDIVRAINMRSKNAPVKAVASTSLNLNLLSASKSGISKTSELNEKVFAVTRHSAIDFLTDKILEANSLAPKSLNKPQINDLKIRTQMFNRNQFDGTVLPQPYAAYSQCLGAHNIDNSDKYNINLSALLSNDSVITCRREDITKLIKAYDIAASRLNQMYSTDGTGKDKATADVKDMLHILPTGIQYPDTMRLDAKFPQSSNISLITFKSALKWFEDQRLVPKSQSRSLGIEYTEIIDTSFCNDAKK